MSGYDFVFVFTALAFNLLIAGIFIAQKKGRADLVRQLGRLWLLLALPLAIVFIHYLCIGQDTRLMIYFGSIFLYIVVELVLDHVMHIEFRTKPAIHIPYIILEYIALFSFIGITFALDSTWGYIVTLSFWVLMGSLIYLYWDKITRKEKNS